MALILVGESSSLDLSADEIRRALIDLSTSSSKIGSFASTTFDAAAETHIPDAPSQVLLEAAVVMAGGG